MTESIARASRGPTPETVCTVSNMSRSAGAEKPKRVRESSRTTRLVASDASLPRRQAEAVAGVVCTSMPTPPTSTTTWSRPTWATGPRTEAITGGPARRAARASSRATWAPRQAWQIARARASAASAGLGRDLEAEDAGDHGRDLRLVGAAGAGDRGLDLGRGVEDDGDAALGRREQGDGGGVRGGHDRGDVDVGEDPLDGDDVGVEPVEPGVELALEEDQPLPRVGVARGAHDARPPPSWPGRAGRRRRRGRTGSGRGRRRARARWAPSVVRTPVRDATLHSARARCAEQHARSARCAVRAPLASPDVTGHDPVFRRAGRSVRRAPRASPTSR